MKLSHLLLILILPLTPTLSKASAIGENEYQALKKSSEFTDNELESSGLQNRIRNYTAEGKSFADAMKHSMADYLTDAMGLSSDISPLYKDQFLIELENGTSLKTIMLMNNIQSPKPEQREYTNDPIAAAVEALNIKPEYRDFVEGHIRAEVERGSDIEAVIGINNHFADYAQAEHADMSAPQTQNNQNQNYTQPRFLILGFVEDI